MNFFKSVFGDESESEGEAEAEKSESREEEKQEEKWDPMSKAWSLGGLMKSITSKSESVIETYRRDLEEFGSGVKKEIQVAQGSLESVSHKLEELRSSVIKGRAHMISESDENKGRNGGSIKYSRFDAQLRGVQGDEDTYCEEPEDVEDFRKWRRGFEMSEKREEMDRLVGQNGVVSGFFNNLVLGSGSGVDEDTFWCRYFYRVWKLEQAEALRVSLVKRAISKDDDEDLSWDVDDDDGGGGGGGGDDEKDGLQDHQRLRPHHQEELVQSNQTQISSLLSDGPSQPNLTVHQVKLVDNDENKQSQGEQQILSAGNHVSKHDEEIHKSGVDKVESEGKEEEEEEEDLGWDEIEDLSGIDDKKATSISSQNKADIRKRLSVAEEDEDLSWDIEDDDDDDHVKA